MHQNAPLPVKKIKKISEGAQPPPQTPLVAFGASIIAPSALGVPVPFHLRLEHWRRASLLFSNMFKPSHIVSENNGAPLKSGLNQGFFSVQLYTKTVVLNGFVQF